MEYTIQQLSEILSLPETGSGTASIQYLVTDSRKVVFPEQTLFFAIKGPRRSGLLYIPELYHRGVRNFVTEEAVDTALYPDAVFLEVADTVKALQQIAAYHRRQFSIPVIGITGSNGKTIVKEWLFRLLEKDHSIVRSPRSYNSQIGVPLSVWQMGPQHTLGIFEAGISAPGEMNALEAVIRPTIGILTNIGEAHSEGFGSNAEKLVEKSLLFQHTEAVVVAKDQVKHPVTVNGKLIQWGNDKDNFLRVTGQQKTADATVVKTVVEEKEMQFRIPFRDDISVQNVLTCITVMLHLGYSHADIQSGIAQLEPVEMRMQLRKGINQCFVLNDSYSNDKGSLELALSFIKEQAGEHSTTVVLSDIAESAQPVQELYKDIEQLLTRNGVGKLYAVGNAITTYFQQRLNAVSMPALPFSVEIFPTTEVFLETLNHHSFQQEYILLKGARRFEFERIAHWLEQQVHQTVLEINLTAMVHNLKCYQALLAPETKLMAMVKAFSYGSGAGEIARQLQQQQVDYLAVAYADEGVALRKAGIGLPIMVMSPDENSFDALINYDLEPEIFSREICDSFQQYLLKQGVQQYPVHLKLNTGMNRLGFDPEEIALLATDLSRQQQLMVKSVFSHLVASEDPSHDAFTNRQVQQFTQACDQLQNAMGYTFIQHIANTADIIRNPSHQFGMVRLGIGLYGVDSAATDQLSLQPVATLKTTVAQVRKVAAGETVGYGRKGVVNRDSLIATVRIGYADGFGRSLGNGAGRMLIHGTMARVIGNVCMDMTMLDVTDIPNVKAGDIAEVFGTQLPVQQMASDAGTIAYEIMTGISQRVKRVYFEE